MANLLSTLIGRNPAVAGMRRCGLSPQKVDATPSSRDKRGTLGSVPGSRDEGVAGTLCDGGVAATHTAAFFLNCIVPVCEI